jgi:hypothetical protein
MIQDLFKKSKEDTGNFDMRLFEVSKYWGNYKED